MPQAFLRVTSKPAFEVLPLAGRVDSRRCILAMDHLISIAYLPFDVAYGYVSCSWLTIELLKGYYTWSLKVVLRDSTSLQ